MPRVHHVKAARKARPEDSIAIGDSYYWWAFRYGGKRYSKKYPRPSQLTQSKMSDVYAAIEAARDDLPNATTAGDIATMVERVADTVRNTADEYQEAADEHFGGGGPSGERADELGGWADDLESFECEEREDGETEDDFMERLRGDADVALDDCPL